MEKSGSETEMGPDEAMTTMFTAVFVKVEVVEEEEEVSKEQEELDEIVKPRTRSRTNGKMHKCSMCEYTTKYKNCYELHIRSHNPIKPYTCEFCDYATKHPMSLQRHVYTMHESKEPEGKNLPDFNCDKCEYSTKIKWNLYSHRRKHKTVKKYKCSKCDYASAYRQDYVKHSKSHEMKEKQSFQCDKCPFFTRFHGHMVRHLSQIHNEITDKAHSCLVCGLTTLVKWRLTKHVMKSKQTLPMRCVICNFETYYKCENRKHKLFHCSKGDQLLNFPTKNEQSNDDSANEKIEANAVLNDQVPVTEHPLDSMDMSTQFDYAVPKSSEQFSLGSDMNFDWNNVPVTESNCTERFQCNKCEYKSKFKAAVQRHFQRKHTDSTARPYKCTACGFATKTKDQISLHTRRSKVLTPLMCNFCNLTTLFKCELVVHQKTHYDHKCKACGSAYKNIYELKRHYASMHLGEGMNCQFCEYKTMRKECLVSHMSTHTGVKPFKCQYCGYGTLRRHILEYHIKKYHADAVVASETETAESSTLDKLLSQDT